MKKIFLIFLSALLAFTMTACEDKGGKLNVGNTGAIFENGTASGDPVYLYENAPLTIYNSQNERIGEIEYFYNIVQTDGGLVYSKIHNSPTNTFSGLDFYRYSFETKEEIHLGYLKDWSLGTEEAVCLNNHLFLIGMEGDYTDQENRVLKLLDFNLDNNTMSYVFSEKGGWPYTQMVGVGNRLLFTRVTVEGSFVEEYNTDTKEFKELLFFNFDNENNIGDAVRQIAVYGDEISLLIVQMNTENDVKLRVDTYDANMNFIRSVDVSDITKDASNADEIRQLVVHFKFFNDYLYYENRSITSFLGTVADETAKNFLSDSQTGYFSMARDAANQDGSKLFYRILDYNDNALYRMDTATGEIGRAVFNCPDEPRYQLKLVSRDTNGNLLIHMGYKDPNTSEELPPRAYYLNQSELDFTPVESIDIPEREY